MSSYWKPVKSYLVPRFGNPVADWHLRFAWFPTWTDDEGWKWLCCVWRRRIQKHNYLNGGTDFWWQYAACQRAREALSLGENGGGK